MKQEAEEAVGLLEGAYEEVTNLEVDEDDPAVGESSSAAGHIHQQAGASAPLLCCAPDTLDTHTQRNAGAELSGAGVRPGRRPRAARNGLHWQAEGSERDSRRRTLHRILGAAGLPPRSTTLRSVHLGRIAVSCRCF